jgi:arylsulfatase A
MGEVDGWYCDVIVDKACDWLKNKRDKEKPFFMYICSHEPHTPIEPPVEYSRLYDNHEVEAL